jgi:hypothetical protein
VTADARDVDTTLERLVTAPPHQQPGGHADLD